MMFASSIKGTANVVAGGWGNLGGGITNMVMPLIFTMIVGFGYTGHEAEIWDDRTGSCNACNGIFIFQVYERYTGRQHDEINRTITTKAKTTIRY